MPDIHRTLSIAAVCVILCGLILASPVAAEFLGGSLISSSTSISGNVVVNETVSVKKVTYTDGFPKIQEWTFQETVVNPGARTWTTEMTFMPKTTGPKFSFSRTGNLFYPFSFTL